MESMKSKRDLRLWAKEKRRQLTEEGRIELSMEITNRLLELPIWDLVTYHLFLTIDRQKEMDTEPLLALLQGKDKRVVVGKSNADLSMTHFLLDEHTSLEFNTWGIPEPREGIEISPKQIDVVFVPLLIADKRGHRVGYGKGFYDRFLAQLRPETLAIGLSLFEPVDQILDTDSYDQPLNWVISPTQSLFIR